MWHTKILLAFLIYVHLLDAQSPCVFNINNVMFDFTKFVGQELKVEVGQDGPDYYEVSFCGNLQEACDLNGQIHPAAVVRRNSDDFCIGHYGDWNTGLSFENVATQMYQTPTQGVALVIKNGMPCAKKQGVYWSTRYKFTCYMGSDIGDITVQQNDQLCQIQVNVPTKAGCKAVDVPPQPSPSPNNNNNNNNYNNNNNNNGMNGGGIVPGGSTHTSTEGDWKGRAICLDFPSGGCLGSSFLVDLKINHCNDAQILMQLPDSLNTMMPTDVRTNFCDMNRMMFQFKMQHLGNVYMGDAYVHVDARGTHLSGQLMFDPFTSASYTLQMTKDLARSRNQQQRPRRKRQMKR